MFLLLHPGALWGKVSHALPPQSMQCTFPQALHKPTAGSFQEDTCSVFRVQNRDLKEAFKCTFSWKRFFSLPLITPSLTSHFSSHVTPGPSACLSYVIVCNALSLPCQHCILPVHKHAGICVHSPIFCTVWWLHEISVRCRKENLSSMIFLVATCVEVRQKLGINTAWLGINTPWLGINTA